MRVETQNPLPLSRSVGPQEQLCKATHVLPADPLALVCAPLLKHPIYYLLFTVIYYLLFTIYMLGCGKMYQDRVF